MVEMTGAGRALELQRSDGKAEEAGLDAGTGGVPGEYGAAD